MVVSWNHAMTTDFTTSYWRVMIWRLRKAAQLGGATENLSSIGFAGSKKKASRTARGWTVGAVEDCWTRSTFFGESTLASADARLERKSARARRWRHGTSGGTGRLGRTAMPAYVSVFGYASLVPELGKPIRNGRRRKKTPRPAGRCPRSTAGPLTNSLRAARLPLSHMSAPVNQGPRAAACDTSVPHVCGVESLSSLGNRVRFMRWPSLPSRKATGASAGTGCRVVVIKGNSRYRHARLPRECRATGRRLGDGLLAALQPRIESDWTGLESRPAVGACTTDTFQCWRRSLRRSLKTGVTETKPYLDYAQTPKTLCLAFNQNTRWTTWNCGPRRDVLFTMGNATTTNSAVWCSRSQRCGALQRNHPGIESSSFLPSAPER